MILGLGLGGYVICLYWHLERNRKHFRDTFQMFQTTPLVTCHQSLRGVLTKGHHIRQFSSLQLWNAPETEELCPVFQQLLSNLCS